MTPQGLMLWSVALLVFVFCATSAYVLLKSALLMRKRKHDGCDRERRY